MHELIIADLGPNVTVWTGRVAGILMCVVTPRVVTDVSVRRSVRELLKRQGVDCSDCHGCLIGSDQ